MSPTQPQNADNAKASQSERTPRPPGFVRVASETVLELAGIGVRSVSPARKLLARGTQTEGQAIDRPHNDRKRSGYPTLRSVTVG